MAAAEIHSRMTKLCEPSRSGKIALSPQRKQRLAHCRRRRYNRGDGTAWESSRTRILLDPDLKANDE
jgi:hypothetical protein